MNLTPADRELLHMCLLRYLARHGLRWGTPGSLLLAAVRSEALPRLDADTLAAELDYLGDATNALGKALVLRVVKLNPADSRWNLTAAGREYCQERGLDQP
jgi:hypothetical protein